MFETPLFVFPEYFGEPMVISAFAVSIAIVALSFMFGEFFSNAGLKAFAKYELKELGVSAVIVVLAIVLVLPGSLFDIASSGFAPPPPAGQMPKICDEWKERHGDLVSDPITGAYRFERKGSYAFSQAQYFLGCRWRFADIATGAIDYVGGDDNGVLMPHLVGTYFEFMSIEAVTGFLSSFHIGITLVPELLPGFEFSPDVTGVLPFIYINPINEAHTLVVDVAGTLVAATASQRMLLDFIELNVPKIILPLGLIMRVFPFTRKTGSTIVAFAFAAYFIYPTSVLINARLYEAIENPPCATGQKPVGETCSSNLDCCSSNCYKGKCKKPLSINDYKSTFTICKETISGVNTEKLARILKDEEEKEQEYLDALLDQQKSSEPLTKTEGRLRSDWDERARREGLRQDRLDEEIKRVFPHPANAVKWAWGLLEHAVVDTAKLLVLVSLFVVIEIIITLTLFKDFSLLIGGEPRLFGISKLV